MELKIVEIRASEADEISVLNTKKYDVIKVQVEPSLVIVYVVRK